ncbi:MAG: retroviral-like aspartic protease family protein, partial [Pirellulaceae bacterium]|nr:retroviral-like aspartic protease family protein [Pirellulaceae bacterium]
GNQYSPAVVAKADKILEDIGLRRSGKTIAATNTTEVSRALTGLARERRQLKLVYKDWKNANDHTAAIRREIRRLSIQDADLNLQLARVAGVDPSANNRVVGLINAGRSRMKILTTDADRARDITSQKRGTLSEAESAYAETILAIRKDFDSIRNQLDESLKQPQTKIALQVMHRNFQTPAPEVISADQILAPLAKRIERVEQEVFSESIPLDVQPNGSLYVDVVVGKKTSRMVVDSGATLISLPATTAQELGITIASDAPDLKLVMADGREIPAKGVTLDRVRVGEFEAEDVQAAVLHASAVGAEPLLGMSFLGNFKFEINSNDKSLKLLRVAAE